MGKGGSNRALSAEEVSERLGINQDYLYRTWRQKGLKAFYIGRQWRILERDLDTYIQAQIDKAA